MAVLRRVANVTKEITVNKNFGSLSDDQGKEGSKNGGHVGIQVFATLAQSVLPHSFSAPEH